MNHDVAQRALDRIARLAASTDDLVSFWKASSDVLSAVVPHYWTPCWYTLDPASLLITSHFHDGLPVFPAEWLTQEYYGDDVNKLAGVARSSTGLTTLHEETGGNPSQSPRWHENMKLGGDQELLLALRTRSGEVWGALGLYREPGQPLFDDREMGFLRSAAHFWALGIRKGLLIGEACDPEGPTAPGLLILNERWEVDSTTSEVGRWLEAMPGDDWRNGRLPPAVMAVAAEAARVASAPDRDRSSGAESLVRAETGSWLTLHASAMDSPGGPRVAVIVEPVQPARIVPLLMAAYGLTQRERDVTRLVLLGSSTVQIADALVVSEHTVQAHLKRVVEKTGVRSRRDLVATIFFGHYEPRLRDNERRVAEDKPVRGGPMERSEAAPPIASRPRA